MPLSVVAEDPSVLLREDRKDPHRFRLTARSELGQNRRSGRKPGFVQSVIDAIESFYGGVLQDLTPYQRKAPKRTVVAPEETPTQLPSVPLVAAKPLAASGEVVDLTSSSVRSVSAGE